MITSLILTALVAAPSCSTQSLVRHEYRIESVDRDISLFMMRIDSPKNGKTRKPVVLVHGAGSSGSAIWDLKHRDYSMMRHLACAGFDVYSVDFRGFGGSTMPKAMIEAADRNPPAVRARVAMRDLRAAVEHARSRSKTKSVDVVAWSWGSVVAGLYAGEHPSRVRRLILYAPVYDRRWPKRHIEKGAWREEVKKDLLKYTDAKREEDEIWLEHLDGMFRFSGGEVLRLPNGPYRDIYGEDAPMWDPKKVKAATMVVRGTADRASLEEHARRLFDALENAEERRYVVIGGAKHFLMRERRYMQFQRLITEFLSAPKLYHPP